PVDAEPLLAAQEPGRRGDGCGARARTRGRVREGSASAHPLRILGCHRIRETACSPAARANRPVHSSGRKGTIMKKHLMTSIAVGAVALLGLTACAGSPDEGGNGSEE